MKSRSLLFACALILAGCADDGTMQPESEPAVSIRSGTFFSMCSGYCLSEITINPVNAIYVEWSREPEKFPERSDIVDMGNREWQDLTAVVDMAELAALDSIIGCPDCADGGGEWIEVRSAGQSKRIVFGYGATVEPIADLLQKVRAIRMRAKI